MILRNRNSQISTGSGEAHRKLNRLSTSSSLSIITPPTTPKRPSSSGRLKMAFSLSLAQNFNQKLASLNDKWNDFSFILKSNPIKGTGGTARNDSYHSIESAVTCTAADLEAGNFSGGGGDRGDDGDERYGRASGQGGSRGLWNSSGSKHHQHHRHHQKPYERHKQRLTSPRRNSASGDPKEFDMLVLKAMDNGEDNESF